MQRSPPFSSRRLDRGFLPRAIAFTRRVGVPGIYVQNHLLTHPRLGGPAEILAFHGPEDLVGLAYCGDRGNLILLTDPDLDPEEVAAAVARSSLRWRIVLGPPAVVGSLAARGTVPLVHRSQIYYAVAPEAVPAARLRDDVRLARRQDARALVVATLHLNEADLGVEVARINKDWVRNNVKQRIRQGLTLVIGPVGSPLAKLDIGSKGPAGVILEGVYTWPEARGHGYAAGLVATAAHDAGTDCPVVCLHVAADNKTARRAYENAGMREAGRCSLLLIS